MAAPSETAKLLGEAARSHWRDDASVDRLIRHIRGGCDDVNARHRVPEIRGPMDGWFTPLSFACRMGETGLAKKLLEDGEDPNDPCGALGTALRHAVDVGNLSMARVLLAANADPDYVGWWTPQRIEIARQSLGADNWGPLSPLQKAQNLLEWAPDELRDPYRPKAKQMVELLKRHRRAEAPKE